MSLFTILARNSDSFFEIDVESPHGNSSIAIQQNSHQPIHQQNQSGRLNIKSYEQAIESARGNTHRNQSLSARNRSRTPLKVNDSAEATARLSRWEVKQTERGRGGVSSVNRSTSVPSAPSARPAHSGAMQSNDTSIGLKLDITQDIAPASIQTTFTPGSKFTDSEVHRLVSLNQKLMERLVSYQQQHEANARLAEDAISKLQRELEDARSELARRPGDVDVQRLRTARDRLSDQIRRQETENQSLRLERDKSYTEKQEAVLAKLAAEQTARLAQDAEVKAREALLIARKDWDTRAGEATGHLTTLVEETRRARDAERAIRGWVAGMAERDLLARELYDLHLTKRVFARFKLAIMRSKVWKVTQERFEAARKRYLLVRVVQEWRLTHLQTKLHNKLIRGNLLRVGMRTLLRNTATSAFRRHLATSRGLPAMDSRWHLIDVASKFYPRFRIAANLLHDVVAVRTQQGLTHVLQSWKKAANQVSSLRTSTETLNHLNRKKAISDALFKWANYLRHNKEVRRVKGWYLEGLIARSFASIRSFALRRRHKQKSASILCISLEHILLKFSLESLKHFSGFERETIEVEVCTETQHHAPIDHLSGEQKLKQVGMSTSSNQHKQASSSMRTITTTKIRMQSPARPRSTSPPPSRSPVSHNHASVSPTHGAVSNVLVKPLTPPSKAKQILSQQPRELPSRRTPLAHHSNLVATAISAAASAAALSAKHSVAADLPDLIADANLDDDDAQVLEVTVCSPNSRQDSNNAPHHFATKTVSSALRGDMSQPKSPATNRTHQNLVTRNDSPVPSPPLLIRGSPEAVLNDKHNLNTKEVLDVSHGLNNQMLRQYSQPNHASPATTTLYVSAPDNYNNKNQSTIQTYSNLKSSSKSPVQSHVLVTGDCREQMLSLPLSSNIITKINHENNPVAYPITHTHEVRLVSVSPQRTSSVENLAPANSNPLRSSTESLRDRLVSLHSRVAAAVGAQKLSSKESSSSAVVRTESMSSTYHHATTSHRNTRSVANEDLTNHRFAHNRSTQQTFNHFQHNYRSSNDYDHYHHPEDHSHRSAAPLSQRRPYEQLPPPSNSTFQYTPPIGGKADSTSATAQLLISASKSLTRHGEHVSADPPRIYNNSTRFHHAEASNSFATRVAAVHSSSDLAHQNMSWRNQSSRPRALTDKASFAPHVASDFSHEMDNYLSHENHPPHMRTSPPHTRTVEKNDFENENSHIISTSRKQNSGPQYKNYENESVAAVDPKRDAEWNSKHRHSINNDSSDHRRLVSNLVSSSPDKSHSTHPPYERQNAIDLRASTSTVTSGWSLHDDSVRRAAPERRERETRGISGYYDDNKDAITNYHSDTMTKKQMNAEYEVAHHQIDNKNKFYSTFNSKNNQNAQNATELSTTSSFVVKSNPRDTGGITQVQLSTSIESPIRQDSRSQRTNRTQIQNNQKSKGGQSYYKSHENYEVESFNYSPPSHSTPSVYNHHSYKYNNNQSIIKDHNNAINKNNNRKATGKYIVDQRDDDEIKSSTFSSSSFTTGKESSIEQSEQLNKVRHRFDSIMNQLENSLSF